MSDPPQAPPTNALPRRRPERARRRLHDAAPPPRGRIRLPDCGPRRTAFALSPRQRREVIEALARGGQAGLEKWIEEEERRDPYIRRRIHEEHDRLRREARMEKRRAEQAYGDEKADRESRWERRMRETAEREAALHEGIRTARAGPHLDVNELEDASGIYAALHGKADRRRGLWHRLVDALKTVGWFLVYVWIKLVRGIRRLFGLKVPEARTTVVLPDGMKLSLGGLATLKPGVMAQIRYRMKEGATMRERLKRAWDRLLGREDYAETAMRLMEDELRQRYEKKKVEMESEAVDLEARLRELERNEREARRQHREEMDRLEERRRKDLDSISKRMDQGPYEAMRDELVDQLAESGLVDEEGRPTSSLMERFSGLLYDEAMRGLPAGGMATPGTYIEGEGEYEKGQLRSQSERGMVEIVDSVVQARMRHPHVKHLFDEDLLVHREVRTSKTHVVVIFDRSGSMEEKGRMEAARTVSLVLYRAVKEDNPDSRVDLLAMHTGVDHVDLAGAWNADPKGFTNHGRALREARLLLEEESADRRLVYLITDGLPEAMTVNGVDTADRPEVCMPFALEHARKLGETPGVRLMVIQLEHEDEQYLEAARKIAAAGHGTMEAMDPEALTRGLLTDWQAASMPVTEH